MGLFFILTNCSNQQKLWPIRDLPKNKYGHGTTDNMFFPPNFFFSINTPTFVIPIQINALQKPCYINSTKLC